MDREVFRRYINLVEEAESNTVLEMRDLFVAYALNKHYISEAMLTESRIDEAAIWDKVKKAAGGAMSGIKSANDAVNQLGAMAQNTKPVQDFDNKFEALKQKIASKLPPKAVETITQYGEWAKKNPVKQSLILAAIGAIATLAMGPGLLAGGGVGLILGAANKLLKGEKLSSAVGGAVKGAVVGGALGAIANMGIGELTKVFGQVDVTAIPGMKEFARIKINGIPTVMTKADAKTFQDTWDASMKLIKMGSPDGWRNLESLKASVLNPQYYKSIQDQLAGNEALKAQAIQGAQQITKMISQIGAAVQGAAVGAVAGANTGPAGPPGKAATNIAAGAKAVGGAAKGLLGRAAGAVKGALAKSPAATPAAPATPAAAPSPAAASAPIPGTKAFQAARRR
jgi:hypothetical protein